MRNESQTVEPPKGNSHFPGSERLCSWWCAYTSEGSESPQVDDFWNPWQGGNSRSPKPENRNHRSSAWEIPGTRRSRAFDLRHMRTHPRETATARRMHTFLPVPMTVLHMHMHMPAPPRVRCSYRDQKHTHPPTHGAATGTQSVGRVRQHRPPSGVEPHPEPQSVPPGPHSQEINFETFR